MEIQCITRRGKFPGESLSRDHGTVRNLEIKSVVTAKDHLVGGVGKLNVAERLAESDVSVIIKCIAGECVSVARHYKRTAVQIGLGGLCIIHTARRIDGTVAGNYRGSSIENGDMRGRIV